VKAVRSCEKKVRAENRSYKLAVIVGGGSISRKAAKPQSRKVVRFGRKLMMK
jgi:uridylate kinase